MGHCITAIILKGCYEKAKAGEFDLVGVHLAPGLTLFHIDIYYTEYWQRRLGSKRFLETSFNGDAITFPSEYAIAEIMMAITGEPEPMFAIIQTDYFGGAGQQFAHVYRGGKNVDPAGIRTINQALNYLGVTAQSGKDEFDTAGLSQVRQQPDHLDKYADMN